MPMQAYTTPHVVLRNFNTIYTTVSLFLMKPGSGGRSDAVVGSEVPVTVPPFQYCAELTLDEPPRLRPGQGCSFVLGLRNAGNVTWFPDPSRSHMVRVGAWFTTVDGRNCTGEPVRFHLPHALAPGQRCSLAMRLEAPAAPIDGLSLNVGLVKELCFWFRDKGSPDVAIPVRYES